MLLMSSYSVAQKNSPFYPFKGFHVGVTGQAKYVQKCSFVALTGSDPAPKPQWTYGWEAGIEFSYHFAKYFGVSLGLNFGTIGAYSCRIDFSNYPDQRLIAGVSAFTWPAATTLITPIKLEFHYPLRKDLFFIAETGVRIEYGKKSIHRIERNFFMEDYYDTEANMHYLKPYYSEYGWENIPQINCNLLLGIGLYYKLPHGDLLRFTTGINMSFKNIIEGYYLYHISQSWGMFSVKNDFIYTQLSYVHTFNWEKAKKYVKKQEYSFSSKKERRKKIVEVLKNW